MNLPPSGVQVAFCQRRDWLEVVVAGQAGNLRDSIVCWKRIVAEQSRTGAGRILVVDRMQGDTLTREEFDVFLAEFAGIDPVDVRVAIVVRDTTLVPKLEYAALFGRENDIGISFFAGREAAEVWLRHGEA